jgi:AcrR family transcriptional regulator
VKSARDRETRQRLLSAAGRLFAERGFAKVSVRAICRKARANVAAVNYHFNGKAGLYEEVLGSAIRTMQATTEMAKGAGSGKAPDAQLRAYIEVFLHRVAGRDHNSWIHQFMVREMSDPTPALDMVIEQVIRPRMAYLCGVVAELLGCKIEDPRVMRCAVSVHVQCLALFDNPVAHRMSPATDRSPEALDVMVDHIVRFSLAGIDAVRLLETRKGTKSTKVTNVV